MDHSSKVLEIFKEITLIPRESGNEGRIQEYLINFAKSRNLEYKTDEVGNVCIIREASKGKENVPVLVLQGHQDMVCEKTGDSKHDFLHDPIEYVIEDGWMIARETTLGADDGIGIAAMLMLLESDLPMGRIECIFTVSEETGMDGAFGMQPGFFTGRTMINLDSEDEGQLFIGCAGGLDTTVKFSYTTEDQKAGNSDLKLRISNGLGGHSGDDINKNRMNTVKVLADFLAAEWNHGIQLKTFRGGNKPNAIARECEAVITAPDPTATASRFSEYADAVMAGYSQSDPDVKFEAAAVQSADKAVDSKVAAGFIRAMHDCPHGVDAMSKDIPGLVETSTNLAAVRMQGDGVIEIITSQRSSVPEDKHVIAAKVAEPFNREGAEVKHHSEYPGWTPNINSNILKCCVESYRKLFHKDPEVKAIHAGLECGLFGEKFGDIDMISFGPTLRGVHAPGERLELSSLVKFTDHLVDVVTTFGEGNGSTDGKPKVAPSILSGNFLDLEPDLRMLNASADLIHIDVMDGTFVPNISFGFPLVEAMAKVMTIPMDVHLMIINPDKYIERFAKTGAKMISFHLEAAEDAGKNPSDIIAQIHACGVKAGLAIDPDVPVEKLYPFIGEVDFFLIMSVFAGFGGQKFIEDSLGRIRQLRTEMEKRGAVRDIEVDGGVSAANAKALTDAGATILVAGSSVFKADDPAEMIAQIRG